MPSCGSYAMLSQWAPCQTTTTTTTTTIIIIIIIIIDNEIKILSYGSFAQYLIPALILAK